MDAHATRPPIRTEDLDRLADGSLTAEEQRALLSRIDSEPDGWRRCALAFLEAQAWRETFEAMTAQPEAPHFDVMSRSKRPPRTLLFPITLAAALIGAAFLLGQLTVQPEFVDQEGMASVSGNARGFDRTDGGVPPFEASDTTANPSPWGAEIKAIGYLSLPTDSNPEGPVVELPVLTGPGLDDRWLRDQPSFVPEEFRKSWEQLGYEVESQRRLVSVQLDEDGRYLTIPVDDVQIRAIDRTTY
ncbi:hypothetical protein [Tautonia rosea]|uniref:hypothetical protein n=1 Tax=Tautonia rosea TaxID=2728037 RepID=UPI0014732981|nr:hypothetical protein [Tautonia rosea]